MVWSRCRRADLIVFFMPQKTPFLPGVYHLLSGRLPRSQRDRMREEAERLRQASFSGLCHTFGPWLPEGAFASGSNDRRRSYPTSITFWAFLSQVLNPGASCREVVRKVQVWHQRRKQAMPSSATGAYCQARQRLPLERLSQAHEALEMSAPPKPASIRRRSKLGKVN